MLDEFQDAISFFALNGQGVKLEGLGTFSPKIDLKGEMKIRARISNRLNDKILLNAFQGDVANRDSIGTSTDDLIAMWKKEHADDPIA